MLESGRTFIHLVSLCWEDTQGEGRVLMEAESQVMQLPAQGRQRVQSPLEARETREDPPHDTFRKSLAVLTS